VTGPIKYAYFSGSSTAWAWVQVRNHRHPIAKLEALMGDGHYAELERSSWGYFKAVNLPAGTQTYRVTDIYGHVLEDSGIVVLDEGEIDGHDQFPPCTPPSDGSYDRSLVGRLSRRPTTCGRSLSVSSTCAVSATRAQRSGRQQVVEPRVRRQPGLGEHVQPQPPAEVLA